MFKEERNKDQDKGLETTTKIVFENIESNSKSLEPSGQLISPLVLDEVMNNLSDDAMSLIENVMGFSMENNVNTETAMEELENTKILMDKNSVESLMETEENNIPNSMDENIENSSKNVKNYK